MHVPLLLFKFLRRQSALWSLFLRRGLHPVVDCSIVRFLFICYELVYILINLYSIGDRTRIVFEFDLELSWLIVASFDIQSSATCFLKS